MEYTVERIKALAAMAHVAVADTEAEALCCELNAMRAIAETLRGVSDLPDPFYGAIDLDAMRADVCVEGLSHDILLSLSPCVERNATVVPRAIEG